MKTPVPSVPSVPREVKPFQRSNRSSTLYRQLYRVTLWYCWGIYRKTLEQVERLEQHEEPMT